MCVFQLGLGHSNQVKEPTLITMLQGKNIRQISAGRCHSAAWTTPSTSMKNSGKHAVRRPQCTCVIHEKKTHTPLLLSSPGGPGNFQLGLPQSVPPQYNTLKDCSPDALSMRLRVLYNFSDLMYKSWRLLNLDPKNPVIFWSFSLAFKIFHKTKWIDDKLLIFSLHHSVFHCDALFTCTYFILRPSCYPVVHFTLQFRYDRHHQRWAPGPSVTQGQHSASSALNWQNNDPGQDLRATDHSETNFHKVRTTMIFRCAQRPVGRKTGPADVFWRTAACCW